MNAVMETRLPAEKLQDLVKEARLTDPATMSAARGSICERRCIRIFIRKKTNAELAKLFTVWCRLRQSLPGASSNGIDLAQRRYVVYQSFADNVVN